MNENKCSCGYPMRFPGEQEAFDLYGCAKTITRRTPPFNNLEIVTCTRDGQDPVLGKVDDSDFTSKFKQNYPQNAPPKK